MILQHTMFGAVTACAVGTMAGDTCSGFFAVGEGAAESWGIHGVVSVGKAQDVWFDM